MDTPRNGSQKDDTLFFADETGPGEPPVKPEKNFKLLIVDDENEIHVMTKLVLDDYQYMDHGIEFISAYSGKEAKAVLEQNDDIACCLLDVVMETKDAGLEVARFIREELKNTKIRILLRTGQPGKAPEKDIILNYDINDYKEKTELTTQKLFTTITTALRSYSHLVELDLKNKEIQAKNIRLNEEIARRIVAESNLTKYNRSLERMIESKTMRLKEALDSLKKTEEQLLVTQKSAIVSDVSSVSLKNMDISNTQVDENLKKMNFYREQMTFLLEKYHTLESIITLHKDSPNDLEKAAEQNLKEIGLFKQQIDLDELLEKYPQIIQDALGGIEQISRAIRDVMMFVNISEEPYQPCDVNQIVKTVSELTEFKGQNIDYQFDLNTLPPVNLPCKNIKKAVHAVLQNAMMAVSPHGIISISTQSDESRIELSISDIGQGIDETILPRVFEPYFSGWNLEDHKGLGLSFAKSVLLSCGGDIQLISTPGEGTTVTFHLPIEKTTETT